MTPDTEPRGHETRRELELRLAAHAHADPERASCRVYADWLEDQGRPTEAALYRGLAAVGRARDLLEEWVAAPREEELESVRYLQAECTGLYHHTALLDREGRRLTDMLGRWWNRRENREPACWVRQYRMECLTFGMEAAGWVAELPGELAGLE